MPVTPEPTRGNASRLAITCNRSTLGTDMSAAHDHDHPKAAPGELDYVRVFVNTLDLETHEEQLADPSAAAAWFAERGLLPEGEQLTDADVRQAHEMREALRKLLLAHNGGALEPAAVESVNAAAKSAELVVRFDERGEAGLVPVRPG